MKKKIITLIVAVFILCALLLTGCISRNHLWINYTDDYIDQLGDMVLVAFNTDYAEIIDSLSYIVEEAEIERMKKCIGDIYNSIPKHDNELHPNPKSELVQRIENYNEITYVFFSGEDEITKQNTLTIVTLSGGNEKVEKVSVATYTQNKVFKFDNKLD